MSKYVSFWDAAVQYWSKLFEADSMLVFQCYLSFVYKLF